MPSHFENARIGAKLRFTRNFFIMVLVQKSKTITNRQNLKIVLLAHFQIIVDVIEYYASAGIFFFYLFVSRHKVHSMNTHTLQNAG